MRCCGMTGLRARMDGLRWCLQVIREWRQLQVGQTVIAKSCVGESGTRLVSVVAERPMPDGSVMWYGQGGLRPVEPGSEAWPRGTIAKVGCGIFWYQMADGTERKGSVWRLVGMYLWGSI
jgi:hypothetical protein